MNLSGLLRWFDKVAAYDGLRQDLAAGETPGNLGLLRAARPAVVAALARDLGRTMLLVAGSVERAQELARSLRDWVPDSIGVVRFPEPLALFYERAPWSEEAIVGRLSVISELFARTDPGLTLAAADASGPTVVVSSARALMQRTMPRQQYRLSIRHFVVGQVVNLSQVVSQWAGLGYEPVSVVEKPGQFSHRGGILDVFPPSAPLAVRLELFGSQVDSIRRFDPTTQRSQDRIESVAVTPAREALPRHGPRVAGSLDRLLASDLPPDVREQLEAHHQGLLAATPFPGVEFYLPLFYTRPATLLGFLPQDALIVVDDERELADAWAVLEKEAVDLRAAAEEGEHLPADYPLPYATWDDWSEQAADRPCLCLGQGPGEGSSRLSESFSPGPRFGGQLKPVMTHLENAQQQGVQVVVASQQARRLAELWGEQHDHVPTLDGLHHLPSAPLVFVQGAATEGWVLSDLDDARESLSLQVLSDAEIFGWRRPQPRRIHRPRKIAPETHFADLAPGDFVVHLEYGVGIFQGLVTRALEGAEREYLLVQYGGSDRLYVPIPQADRLGRYVGVDDRAPSLSRLGTVEWQTVKERAKNAAADVARELVELYAAREYAPGHAFGPDTPWQAELEAAFPYYETEDQLQAIADVKRDMEKPKPMDRIICGDVGYGKTEVAVRAAFKAVMDGKQVAVLVPTTVLAQQHYATFRRRLSPFPVVVEMLSRFRSAAEQRDILDRLRLGQVDIVVGTHRLIQKDVVFSDLGLLVVDEEQRFGVTHKERLKEMRTEVDVLTMTATPIPRTLYMAVTGVRDISTIETPPEERLPVTTYVGEYDSHVVRRAILREMERNGQVFYVHNRVQTIQSVRKRLERLVPEASVAVAHGQMREASLEQEMLRFVAGEVDVLVCTTIIESGLDIPNANTLIVEGAQRFGLAQLYQLRGRVGRGAQRAYAHFFHDRWSRLNVEARQRLETIREASELGAGYSIAMRDLEIRGAGDILGTRQSGHISAVGFELYTRLLAQAVREMKARRDGRPLPPARLGGVRIDLGIPARLPADYVPDARLRLQVYRRMAGLTTLEEIADVGRELVDRFGPLPPATRDLVFQLELKALARDASVSAIVVENGRLVLRSNGKDFPGRESLREYIGDRGRVGRRDIWLSRGKQWRDDLVRVLEVLGAMTIDG